jgi:putative ABC transport system permease protein
MALGLLLALVATRLISSLLVGVSAYDPLTFCGVTLLMAAVLLMASYIPARRASRVDPSVALRYE